MNCPPDVNGFINGFAPHVVLTQDDRCQCKITLDGVELPSELVIDRVEYPQAPDIAPMIYFKMQASSFTAVTKTGAELRGQGKNVATVGSIVSVPISFGTIGKSETVKL